MYNMKLIFLSLFIFSSLNAQNSFLADPYYLLDYELELFKDPKKFQSTSIRPFYLKTENKLSIRFNNEVYFNNNASNQENMDLRYIGKGIGHYKSLSISAYSKYLAFNFEPFSLIHNYKDTKEYYRPNPYKRLNDAKTKENLNQVGLRKADIYLHFNGVGIGYTNSNMWWGPGIQGSLSMTNNTEGFQNYMLGTIKELRWKDFGFMARYTFSDLNKKSGYEATYFTSLTGQFTFYSKKQIISFGLSRNFLTGGVDIGVPWSRSDAQKIVFESLFIKNLQKLDYTIAGHDPWDQTISGWTEILFMKDKLKLYIEIGLNDNRFNFWDFVVHPDHAMGSIVGFRKYGFLDYDSIVFGAEYSNLIKGRHHIFRETPNWYDRSQYDDFSFSGRRWGSHSGSDSDDLLIYFGFKNNKWSFIPYFNFERHGVSTYRPPEIKTEIRIDTRYNFNNNINIGLYYESQFEAHLGFPPDQYFVDEITGKRRTNTLILKFEKNIY